MLGKWTATATMTPTLPKQQGPQLPAQELEKQLRREEVVHHLQFSEDKPTGAASTLMTTKNNATL